MGSDRESIYILDLNQAEIDWLESAVDQKPSCDTLAVFQGSGLGDNGMELLTKILAAAKVEVNDYLLLDKEAYPFISFYHLKQSFPKLRYILIFQVDPEKLGLQLSREAFKIFHVGEQQFVLAPSLDTLAKDEMSKRQLWTALKELYRI